MNRIFFLGLVSLSILVACDTNRPKDANEAARNGTGPEPYQPVSRPESIEFANDRLDFYPDDFRKDPTRTNMPVIWAGIIRKTDARERDSNDQIFADTVFEHHYFDWVQERGPDGLQLSLSPRGEGLFRTRWVMNKNSDESSADIAEKFASPGKLAIFYGVPEKVEPDGTIVMHYRYLRIIGRSHFNTNEFDYGRMGEPFHSLPPHSKPYGMTGKGG
jgi:hypothetical protein